ncbi:MAG: phosphoribosylformylglycinamidine synthase subunit PurL [Leptospiraceae bacterium]|nr:phosphoribosylformylglycinamidine synthase subunit PurL [Leptospiraceae bacterium]MDW7976118.1 phosphoribosylformylglycinamidine synthase subunit PurL [Leptospiraceae bacterium]
MNNHQLFSEKEVEVSDALAHNLTEEEFKEIKKLLGRNPTFTELGIFSGMWSEHCSYKNSILVLKELPKESARTVAKAGEENAGALDIGDNLVVVFKIESHNHPTAVEPFQGAATGVGGIMRDVFTMGARPLCSLNSLRFGPPEQPKNQYLFRRAVEGIAFYGNCLGVAVAGGEVFFDPSYTKNCLVNAMTVGVAFKHQLAKARASGIGNPVFYVGADTGRDGIHGASFASQELNEKTQTQRSAVQVGDPFKEKLLMEATLEAIRSGAVIGIQDMGAAGLSSSSSEMAAKGNVGIDLFLDKVPLREKGMIPYEIMLSESQERMLVIVDKDKKDIVKKIFDKWGLHSEEIGVVTDTKRLRVFFQNKLYADIPVHALSTEAPKYKRDTQKPPHIEEALTWNEKELTIPDEKELVEIFYKILKTPNVASKRPVYDQYDQEVGLVRVQGPGGQGGLIRIPANLIEDLELENESYIKSIKLSKEEKERISRKGIAVSVDCNPRYVYLNPYVGAQLAVFESARNVAVLGAEPIGITNNLNFGNPYKPENYYMFEQSVKGMGDACRVLNIPVTGGNVSFYNESDEGVILPTPTIGMVGIMEDVSKAIQPFFRKEGDQVIYLVGKFEPTFGGSEYLYLMKNQITGKIPDAYPEIEKKLIEFLLYCFKKEWILSAGDLSLGGLSVILFRMAYHSWSQSFTPFLLDVEVLNEFYKIFKRWDKIFFGETSASIIISLKRANEKHIQELLNNLDLPYWRLGEVNPNLQMIDFGVFKAEIQKSIDSFEKPLQSVFYHY